jgi:hypothetical protein
MTTSNKEKNIFKEIQEKLFYMIPEKWESIYLYASIIEEPFKKSVGEMYFYYFPKGILKRKPVNVYQIPGMFNIDEESYNEIVQELYLEIKKLRAFHREIKDELWTNLTISIENFQFKVEYGYENLGENAEFTPYERHIIWRYKKIDSDINHLTKEEKNIIDRYFDSELIMFERENNDVYVESCYKQPVHNIIDYEKTLTIEAAIASNSQQDNEKNERIKDKKEKIKKLKKQKDDVKEPMNNNQINDIDNNNQILFDRVEKMKKAEEKKEEDNDIDDDFILTSDFMTKKD